MGRGRIDQISSNDARMIFPTQAEVTASNPWLSNTFGRDNRYRMETVETVCPKKNGFARSDVSGKL